MISADAKAVGINITPDYPDYNAWQAARNGGTFDLVIDNSVQISDTPFTYYQYMYTLPILQNQTNFNFQRFEDKDAWALVQKLDETKKSDTAGDAGDPHPARDHLDAEAAGDTALVQRRLVAGRHDDLDQLAVVDDRRQLHPGDVERLSADDGHRRDHPRQAGRQVI